MKMANSITDTRISGTVIDWKVSSIIRNTAIIEIMLTTLKSLSVIVIKSFVQGASPISMPLGAYSLRIWFSSAIC